MDPSRDDHSPAPRLRDRIRWGNVAWAACAVAAIVFALAWPRLGDAGPVLPPGTPTAEGQGASPAQPPPGAAGDAGAGPVAEPATTTSTTSTAPTTPGTLSLGGPDPTRRPATPATPTAPDPTRRPATPGAPVDAPGPVTDAIGSPPSTPAPRRRQRRPRRATPRAAPRPIEPATTRSPPDRTAPRTTPPAGPGATTEFIPG